MRHAAARVKVAVAWVLVISVPSHDDDDGQYDDPASLPVDLTQRHDSKTDTAVERALESFCRNAVERLRQWQHRVAKLIRVKDRAVEVDLRTLKVRVC